MGENWREKIHEHVPLESLPSSYGNGCLRNIEIPIPSLCTKQNISEFVNQLDHTSLETVIVPAGLFL